MALISAYWLQRQFAMFLVSCQLSRDVIGYEES